jgi:hypothetical protein
MDFYCNNLRSKVVPKRVSVGKTKTHESCGFVTITMRIYCPCGRVHTKSLTVDEYQEKFTTADNMV